MSDEIDERLEQSRKEMIKNIRETARLQIEMTMAIGRSTDAAFKKQVDLLDLVFIAIFGKSISELYLEFVDKEITHSES